MSKQIIEEKNQEQKIENKKSFWKPFLLLFFFLIISFYIYIRFIEPKFFQVHEYSIIDSSLPETFNGFKIVHFSDIHYGLTIDKKELSTIVDKINEIHPDVVVFTGDLFDDSIHIKDESYEDMQNILVNIQAKFKKYAVLGDKDYIDKDKFLEIMHTAGFQVLENTHDFLYYHGEIPIEFIGTSSLLEKENNVEQALTTENDIEYFKIWLNHEPLLFDTLIEKDIHPNLLLTGHTLGGLVSIPFYGYLVKQEGIGNYYNTFYHKKRITMYNSNGLGTYQYPIRFLNAPSINFYRLYNH